MSDNQSKASTSTPSDGYTSSTTVRLRYLASGLAFVITVSFIGLVYAVAFGHADTRGIDPTFITVFMVMVVSAVGWTFGLDLVDRYLGSKNGDN